MLSKAAEWSVGAFVASADVEGAIDGIRHHDMTEALLQKSMHSWAVCALMRESFDLDGGVSLPGAPIAPKFSHARGTRQEECGRSGHVEPGTGQRIAETCSTVGS